MNKFTYQAALLVALATGVPSFVQAATPTAIESVRVDQVADLISKGRKLLAATDYNGAKASFDEAAGLDQDATLPKVWQLRVAIHLEPMNDLLDRIDTFAKGKSGAGIDYLYGMAFAVKAQSILDAGLSDGTVGMQLLDAQTYLSNAVKNDGADFSDAYPVLARVAYLNSDMDVAIEAADKAVGHYPKSVTAWETRGRIQMRRFLANKDEDATFAASEIMSAEAADNFERAIKLLGSSKTDGRASTRAGVYKQLGDCQGWRSKWSDARTAYAASMGWDPSGLDYGALMGALGDNFVKTLNDGGGQFVKRWGTETSSDATLLWYLGYARYSALSAQKKEFKPEAEAEFLKAENELMAAYKKWPAYANSLYYVSLARYGRGDFKGMAAALQQFWDVDPSGVVGSVGADLERAVPRISWTVGQCVGSGDLMGAALLSKVLAETDETDSALNWSYNALFTRDHADNLIRSDAKKAGTPELSDLYEAALKSYERAHEIEPGHPNYMNDLAVVLHYNLRRESERALDLYERANVAAQALMDDPEVDEQMKIDFYSIALRDSGNNARLLKSQMAADKKKRDKEAAGGE